MVTSKTLMNIPNENENEKFNEERFNNKKRKIQKRKNQFASANQGQTNKAIFLK